MSNEKDVLRLCNESYGQFLYSFINKFRFKERFHSPNNEFGGRLKCVQFIFVKYI